MGASFGNFIPSEMVWVNSPVNYREPVDNSQYYGLGYIDDAGFEWMTWKAGLALHRHKDGVYEQDSARVDYVNSTHFGLEFVILHTAAIRMGLSDKRFTLGAGVTYKRFNLDYTYRFDRIENSYLRVSLGVSLF
jgi:hypothetical protein